MANYSTIKYQGLIDAGFARTADITSTIDSKVATSKRAIIGQLDRTIAGGNSATTIFLDRFSGGAANTSTFDAEYDGGSASG